MRYERSGGIATTFRRVALGLACLCQLGCEPDPDPSQSEGALNTQRSYLAIDSPLFVIGRGEDDAVLNPGPIQLGPDLVYVFDWGDSKLKAFDARTGAPRFSLGRSGEGPGEFRNPVQVTLLPGSHEVWVIDAGVGRLSRISGAQLAGSHTLQSTSGAIANLVPLKSGALAILYSTENRFWARFDTATGTSSYHSFPTPGLQTAPSNHRQSLTAIDTEGRRWAAAFAFTNTFVVYDDSTLSCVGFSQSGSSVEELGPSPNPPFVLGGLAFADSMLLILTRSAERDRLDLVDLYRAEDCTYAASVRLPQRARAVSSNGRLIAVTYLEPIPQIAVHVLPEIR